MRTNNIFGFTFRSPKRERIVRTIFSYPKRQWSVPWLEELTGLPHATVHRTVNGLWKLNMLKSVKVNRRDIIYELVTENPLAKAMQITISAAAREPREIAQQFAKQIRCSDIVAIILYGSSVKGDFRPDSDIDVLVVIKKADEELRRHIHDIAAELSVLHNRTVSALIMDVHEMRREQQGQFLKSVKENMEVLFQHGKISL